MTEAEDSVQRFARLPVPSDFVRWEHYSSYVGQILYRSDGKSQGTRPYPRIDATAMCGIAVYGPRPLAPCLTSLDFKDYEFGGGVSPGCLFFAGALSTLHITISCPSLDFVKYISYLVEYSPKLRVLALDYDPTAPSSWNRDYTCKSFSSIGFLQLMHLRELRLTQIYTYPSAIPELASLPYLEKLDLSLSSSAHGRDSQIPGAHPVFRTLRDLHVHIKSFSLVANVLQKIPSPCLERFAVTCIIPDDSWDSDIVSDSLLDSGFAAIAAHPSRDVLQAVLFYVHPIQPPWVASETIRPLLSLPALRHLALLNWGSITVDDATLDAMPRAWPHIECLDLCQRVQYMITQEDDTSAILLEKPRATLHGLIPLALRCPRLHAINLSIDINLHPGPESSSVPLPRHGADSHESSFMHSASPPEPRLPRVLPEHSALTRLYVGINVGMYFEPTRENAAQIAALLSGIFPHLERVSCGLEDELEGHRSRGWRSLDSLMTDFHLIREQERRWPRKVVVPGSITTDS
ncbi:hypothetical protein C8T65DRAFT_738301 [Cerioporus squamosus]|nr:hypothetical protein C8T65DRAFT_738301 [Cerioporus squamosus]